MCNSVFISRFASDLDDFIIYRSNLGYKRTTYECPLKRLDKFLAEDFPNCSILTKDIVLTWIEKLPTSENARIIRLFAEYLINIGKEAFVLKTNFVGTKPRKLPYIFNDDELNRLFLSIDTVALSKSSLIEKSAYPVMFRLIYTCGLRPMEARTLKREHVYENTGEIFIENSKENRDRVVIMSDDMNTYVKQYLSVWELYHGENPYLFPYHDKHLSKCQVRSFFNICWKNANPNITIDKLPKVRVYDLRHRFATENIMRWTEQNVNISTMLPYLKTYMGHANLNDTAYYVHLMPERISAYTSASWCELSNLIPEVRI